MPRKIRVILASGSRSRRSILASLGIKFTVIPSNADERTVKGLDPIDTARKIAQLKARAVASKHAGVVIAADTFGVLGNMKLQKPTDLADARRMLRQMSGKRVKIVTGVCVIDTRDGKE